MSEQPGRNPSGGGCGIASSQQLIAKVFIIDYPIEKLISEGHCAAVLVKIREDYLRERGRAVSALSAGRKVDDASRTELTRRSFYITKHFNGGIMSNGPRLVWTIEDVLMQLDWMTKLSAEELERLEEQSEEGAEKAAKRTRARIAKKYQQAIKNGNLQAPMAPDSVDSWFNALFPLYFKKSETRRVRQPSDDGRDRL